ncbi:MAG: hypothetical protein AAGN66_21265 [Acidobacteriota bacterium]
MIGAFEVWRRRSWVWWLPALFVALNLLLLGVYRTTFAGRVASLEESYQDGAGDLALLRQRTDAIRDLLAQVDAQQDTTDTMYREHFSTEAARFTTALREIRALARRSGLDPSSFSYPSSEIEDHLAVRRGINFSVKGTYDELRTFINLLELTDQFLTLEAVSLGGGKGEQDPRLNIRLQLSTLFADSEAIKPLDVPEDVAEGEGTDGDPTVDEAEELDGSPPEASEEEET